MPYRRLVREAGEAVLIGPPAIQGSEWQQDGIRYEVRETAVVAGYAVARIARLTERSGPE